MVYDIRKIEKEDLENYDRSLASLYGVSPDLLGTEPVTVLELPSRVSNRIKFTGARTVSEFFSLTVGQLAFLDGIGLKSFNEIGAALSKYLNACGSVPSESRFFLEYEKMRIDQFGLSARSVNGLMKAGIRTFADLIPLTEEDILNMRGLGVKSVNEIIPLCIRGGQSSRYGDPYCRGGDAAAPRNGRALLDGYAPRSRFRYRSEAVFRSCRASVRAGGCKGARQAFRREFY